MYPQVRNLANAPAKPHGTSLVPVIGAWSLINSSNHVTSKILYPLFSLQILAQVSHLIYRSVAFKHIWTDLLT